MKKFLAMILAMTLMLACGAALAEEAIEAKAEGVMTYAEYDAAALDAEVTIECYVQATQSWWDNKITVYAADQEGAYFLPGFHAQKSDVLRERDAVQVLVNGTHQPKGYLREGSSCFQ